MSRVEMFSPLYLDQVNYSIWLRNENVLLNQLVAEELSIGDRQRTGSLPTFDVWRAKYGTKREIPAGEVRTLSLQEQVKHVALSGLVRVLRQRAADLKEVEALVSDMVLEESGFGLF